MWKNTKRLWILEVDKDGSVIVVDKRSLLNKIYYLVIDALAGISICWMIFILMGEEVSIFSFLFCFFCCAMIAFACDTFITERVWFCYIVCTIISLLIMALIERNVVTFGIIAAIFIFCLIFYKALNNNIVRMCVGAIELALLLTVFFTVGDLPKLLIVMVIYLFLNSVSELIILIGVSKCHNTSLTLLFALFSLMILIMPVKETPYSWQFVFNFANKIEKFVIDIVDSFTFEDVFVQDMGILNYVGYSEGVDTGKGMLMDNETIEFTIHGTESENSLYLRGCVLDKFNGKQWDKSIEHTTLSAKADAWMTLYTCYVLSENPDEMNEYIDIKKQEVTFSDIKTKSLFLPLKTVVYGGLRNEIGHYQGDNIIMDRVQKRDFEYHYQFFDIDYNNDAFKTVVKGADKIAYNENSWNDMVSFVYRKYGVKPDINYSEFIYWVNNANESVEKCYLENDSHLSNRARELKSGLVNESDSDYDKCEKLTKYIATMTYNKSITIPRDENVIDWFLFDSHEGYCVHFATTLACMLRDENIPARVVNGFLSDYEEIDKYKNVVVRGRAAHAWVEAYIKGVGWITLDSTNSDIFNQGMEEAVTDSMDEDENEANHGSVEEEVAIEGDDEALNLSQVEGEISVGDFTSISKDNESFKYLMFFMGTIAFLGVLSAIILFISKYRIKKSKDPNVISREIFKKLDKKYSKKEKYETAYEYIMRLDMSEETKGQLLQLVSIMQEYWYGNKQIKADKVEFMRMVLNII